MKKKILNKIIEKKLLIILGIIFLIFLAIGLKGVKHDLSDQHVYFYMGKLIGEGKIPYRDFFFSHPPLEIYVDAILLKIFGYNIFILKVIPIFFVLLASFFLFKTVKEAFNLKAGLLSTILFLFTYETFRMAGNTGMSLAVLFVVLGVYYYFKERYILSGVFIGIASITNFFSLVPGGILFLFLLFEKKDNKLKLRIRNAKDFLIGFIPVFVLIQLIFVLIAGKEYFFQVYQYHLVKPTLEVVQGLKLNLFKSTVIYNPVIFIGSLFYFFSKKKNLSLFFTTSLIYILFIFSLRMPFPYYYEMALPFLAVLASVSILRFIKKSENKNLLFAFFIVFILLNTIWAGSNFFWVQKNTLKENEHLGLSSMIKANSNKEDLIFGDQLFVPLLALMSDRRIASDFVDTNPLRFQSGFVDINNLVSNLEKDMPRFIVITTHSPLMDYNASKNFFDKNCKVANIIETALPTQFNRNLINEKLYLLYCGENEEE